MKKSFLAVLALVAITQVAEARSPMRLDTRLGYTQLLNAGGPIKVDQLVSVRLLSNGVALKYTCPTKNRRACDVETIARLSARQMDTIERLIERAEGGRIERLPSPAMCFVAPSTRDLFDADNGKVFLRQGHICLGFTQNVRPAAKRLVTIMENLVHNRGIVRGELETELGDVE